MLPFEIEYCLLSPGALGPGISECQTHRPAHPAPAEGPVHSAFSSPPGPGPSVPNGP